MGAPHQRISSGSWTLSSPSLGTCIGQTRSLLSTSTRGWNTWLVIWWSLASRGGFYLSASTRHLYSQSS